MNEAQSTASAASSGTLTVNAAVGAPVPTDTTEAIWFAFGIPDMLVVDNGLDLTSCGVRDACFALGIDLLFTPPRAPWYKGTVERVGRTINTRFIHWLPGTTLGKDTADLGYNGADHAEVSFEDFKFLLERYIRGIHNRSRRSRGRKSGQTLFTEGILNWPVRVPDSIDEFNQAAALTRTAKLQPSGLHFLGLQYQNAELGQIWNRMPGGQRLTFKVDPMDLKSILVENPFTNQFLKVDCVSNFSWPRTLAYHLATRGQAKKDGLDQNEAHDLSLAEVNLKRAVQECAAKSKAALRRMTAELYRQAGDTDDSPAVAPTRGPIGGAQAALAGLDAAFANEPA